MRRREALRQQVKLDAARQIYPLRDKSYDRREQVKFANSDIKLIRAWLGWLDLVGVAPERRRYQLAIHETADVEAGLDFWVRDGVDRQSFYRTSIKKHSPLTNRVNRAERYHGLLTVSVLDGATLYRQIEGWAYAALESLGRSVSGSRENPL